MITRVSGILTARGGTTSHAAVTAKRLGKTAVVECVDLEVSGKTGTVRLAGHDARRRRLGVHRRPDGQYLLRAHPDDGAAAAPARPLRVGGQQPEACLRCAHSEVAQK